MQKFAISRLNLVKKDTFRQYIPFLGGVHHLSCYPAILRCSTCFILLIDVFFHPYLSSFVFRYLKNKGQSKTGKSDRTCSGICTRRKDYFIFSSHDSFIYSSNTRKIRLNFHYFEPKNTILNEELSRIVRDAKAP